MNNPKGRTVREFQFGGNLWQILDDWAQQTGYRLIGQDQYSRLYQRGVGVLTAPQRLQMTFIGNGYRLEAFVWVPLLTRVFTFMLMPEEMPVESGGFLAALPRSRGRKHVNMLLSYLGQPPIP